MNCDIGYGRVRRVAIVPPGIGGSGVLYQKRTGCHISFLNNDGDSTTFRIVTYDLKVNKFWLIEALNHIHAP